MPWKSSIGSCGFEKLLLLVEISKILKICENFRKNRGRRSCSTGYSSWNQVDGSPLVAIFNCLLCRSSISELSNLARQQARASRAWLAGTLRVRLLTLRTLNFLKGMCPVNILQSVFLIRCNNSWSRSISNRESRRAFVYTFQRASGPLNSQRRGIPNGEQ